MLSTSSRCKRVGEAMIYYILPACIAMLNLGINKPTTLRFESAVEYVSLGSEESFVVEVSKNKKLLTIKPIVSQNSVPVVVVTKGGDFQFQGTTTLSKTYSQFVDVRKGEVSNYFQNVHSAKGYEVLEGRASIRVINKQSKPIIVNGVITKERIDTCKGAPLIVNSKRIVW